MTPVMSSRKIGGLSAAKKARRTSPSTATMNSARGPTSAASSSTTPCPITCNARVDSRGNHADTRVPSGPWPIAATASSPCSVIAPDTPPRPWLRVASLCQSNVYRWTSPTSSLGALARALTGAASIATVEVHAPAIATSNPSARSLATLTSTPRARPRR